VAVSSRLLLGNALVWSGRGAEADTELAALGSLARSDAERAQAAIHRVAALAWGLGRPAEAEAMLDAVTSTLSDDAAALALAGMRSVLDASLGRTVQAADAAAGVLAPPECSPPVAQLATWGLAAACGGLGRLDGLDERVTDAAPPRPPAPARTGWRRPVRAPAPQLWPPWPHRYHSPVGNGRSSPWSPVGCPTARSPDG
jgi:hypothetical protein